MTEKRLATYLGSTHIGMLVAGENATMSFDYDTHYQLTVGATPLSLSMPLTRRHHESAVVLPFMDGLLPDDDAVRDRWGREFQVSGRNTFALLRNVGHDLPGAVRLLPESATPDLTTTETFLDEEQIATHIRNLRADPTQWQFASGAVKRLPNAC